MAQPLSGNFTEGTLAVMTVSPNQLQRAISTKKGKVTERFSRGPEDQDLYEFSLEDFTLYPRVWEGEMGLNQSAESLHENAWSR